MPATIHPEHLLKELLQFESVTPHDKGALAFISNLLSENNFASYIQDFGPQNISNLYSVYSSETNLEAFNICFAGHIDVVPPGEGWDTPPFLASYKDDKIYGRGAVDMKGALACMLAAAINLINTYRSNGKINKIKKNISFLITSDEEGDAEYGTIKILEWMKDNGHNIDFAIIGEPTCEEQIGDIIKIGRRGSMHCSLKVFGKQGHVAYPHLAKNPNSIIIKILHDIIELDLQDGDDMFQPSHLEIISIDTNNKISNVIPQESTAKFNIRFNINSTVQKIEDTIHKIIQPHTSGYKLSIKVTAEPFLSKSHVMQNIFSNAVKNITSVTPKYSTSGGTSDARFIKNYCPIVEFGLLSSMAHKIDEYVKISDLQTLYDVYYRALEDLLLSP